MIGFLALAAASTLPCPEVAGVERFWAKPETRWIMVGEMHGTAEMPALFGDMVCQAAAHSRRPITVALEQSEGMQPVIDTFLASDGGPAARAAFLKAPMWGTNFQDGRSSEAMLALYDRLRLMKAAGQIRAVRGFVPVIHAPTSDGPYNALMAERLKAMASEPSGLVLAYMGSVHAGKSSFGHGAATFLPAAADLPPERTISIYLYGNGGTAWNCIADGCKPHPLAARDARRGFAPATDLPWRYDWVFELGEKTTASPPAG